MQNGDAQRPALPAAVFDSASPDGLGPASDDWRIAELALPGADGEEGWVALRVEPQELLPLMEDDGTAEVLAAMRAGAGGGQCVEVDVRRWLEAAA